MYSTTDYYGNILRVGDKVQLLPLEQIKQRCLELYNHSEIPETFNNEMLNRIENEETHTIQAIQESRNHPGYMIILEDDNWNWRGCCFTSLKHNKNKFTLSYI